MTFRVEVVCIGEDGDEARGEVLTMERHQLAMDTLGLTLRESKAMLVSVQDFVVGAAGRRGSEAAARVPELRCAPYREGRWSDGSEDLVSRRGGR